MAIPKTLLRCAEHAHQAKTFDSGFEMPAFDGHEEKERREAHLEMKLGLGWSGPQSSEFTSALDQFFEIGNKLIVISFVCCKDYGGQDGADMVQLKWPYS